MNPEMLSLREVGKIALQHSLQAGLTPLIASSQLQQRFGANAFSWYGIALSHVPGALGVEVRAAFYRSTLLRCGWNPQLGPGSYFSTPDAAVGENLKTGGYCVIGRCTIGHDVTLGDHVSIVTAQTQDYLEHAQTTHVRLGSGVEIGAGARVAAPIGAGAIVRPGAVVTKPVAAGTTVQGNPARPVKTPRGR